MEPFLTSKKKPIMLSILFLIIFGSWIVFSYIDFGHAEKNVIPKDTLRMEINHSKLAY